MKVNRLLKNKFVVFNFFLILILVLKFPIINMSYTRDEFGTYITPSVWIKDNHFNPFYDTSYWGGHPPLLYEVLALAFTIFGLNLWVGHLVIFISAVFNLYFTYLIGSHLYKPEIGFIAALLLLFSPLFFAQIGIVTADVFLIMMTTMTVYYALKKKIYPYLITGTLLVLTKESGIIIIGAIMGCSIIFEKEKIKKLMVYIFPAFIFVLWLFLNKLVYGSPLLPFYFGIFQPGVFFKIIFHRINQIFITDYKLILTSFIFISIIKSKKDLKTRFIATRLMVPVFAYLVCRYIANILFLIEKIFKITLVNLLQINLYNLYSIRYAIPFLVLIILLIPDMIKSKKILSQKFQNGGVMLLVCIFLVILFFSFIIPDGYQLRYMLIIYPFFFILGSRAMFDIFKKNIVCSLVVIIVSVLFISNWWENVYPLCGSCEESLVYLSVVKTHQDMAKFIELNYPDSIILTEYPQTFELTKPWGGYVKKEIKVLGVENSKIPDLNEFDLVYYSNGGIDSKKLEEAVNLYNLTLIKKIEKDDKIAFLYSKNGQINNT